MYPRAGMENVQLSWEDTKVQLQQTHELSLFRQQNTRAVAWIEEKEAFLNNDDVGDSISTVEVLLRKHEAFVSTTEKQSSIIEDMEKKGGELMKNNSMDSDIISSMMKNARNRMESVKEKSEIRMQKLLDSKDLHLFLRKVFDVKTWVKEKVQVALDESYLDFYNLQNKIQKHASFEAEIAANKQRLNAIKEEGENLCKKDHFASQEIANQ